MSLRSGDTIDALLRRAQTHAAVLHSLTASFKTLQSLFGFCVGFINRSPMTNSTCNAQNVATRNFGSVAALQPDTFASEYLLW